MAQVGAPGKVSALLVFLLVFPGVFRVFFFLLELLYIYIYIYIQGSSCVPGRGEFCQNGPPAFGAISVTASSLLVSQISRHEISPGNSGCLKISRFFLLVRPLQLTTAPSMSWNSPKSFPHHQGLVVSSLFSVFQPKFSLENPTNEDEFIDSGRSSWQVKNRRVPTDYWRVWV